MKKAIIILFCAISMICVYSASNAFGEKVLIVSFEGDAKITPRGAAAPVLCEKDMVLEEGARIATGKGAYVRIAFNEAKSNIVEVRENSDVVLKLDGADKIELINGEVFNVLQGLKQREEFRVRTPNAVCAARGSVQDIRVNAKEMTTFAAAIEKSLYLIIAGKETIVEEGFEAFTRGNVIEAIEKMTAAVIETYRSQAKTITGEASRTEEEEKKPGPGGPGGPGSTGGGPGGTSGTTAGGGHLREGVSGEVALANAYFASVAAPVDTAYETSAEALRTQAEGVAGESPSSVGNNGNMQNTANDLTGEGERDTATYATENRLWAGGPGLDFM